MTRNTIPILLVIALLVITGLFIIMNINSFTFIDNENQPGLRMILDIQDEIDSGSSVSGITNLRNIYDDFIFNSDDTTGSDSNNEGGRGVDANDQDGDGDDANGHDGNNGDGDQGDNDNGDNDAPII